MSVNDFEKQVQQKMDELQFAPSHRVWPAVEKEITARKKRRLIFLWLPFLVLMLGGAVWFYHTGVSKSGIANQSGGELSAVTAVTPQKKSDSVTITGVYNKKTASASIAKKNMADENIIEKKSNLRPGRIDKNEIADDAANTSDENNVRRARTSNESGNKQHWKNQYKHADRWAIAVKNAGDKNTGYGDTHVKGAVLKKERIRTKADETITGMTAALLINDDEKADSVNTGENELSLDKTIHGSGVGQTVLLPEKALLKDSIQAENKPATVVASNQNKKDARAKKSVEWGVAANAGMSDISNGFSGLFSNTQLYYSPSNFQSLATGNSGSNAAAAPSAIKTGFSFGAGVFVSRPLGKNYKLFAGLNYVYYSNQITVGAKIDSNSNSNMVAQDQYRTGSTGTYTNRFHFVELPVRFEKQLGKKSHFSIDAGLSFSVLAGTNTLLYDAQNSAYTSNKSLVNKTQLGLLAGFNYRIFSKSLPIEIGPQLNYNLSNIFKKELYGSRHMIFAGINAKLFFHKNK